MRDAHQAGKSVEELRSLKTGQMSVVYRICAIAMGEPPTSFDLLLRVKDEGKDDAKDDAKASESGTKSGIDSRRQIVEHGITPQEFYAKYVGEDLDDFVSLTNSPLASTRITAAISWRSWATWRRPLRWTSSTCRSTCSARPPLTS